MVVLWGEGGRLWHGGKAGHLSQGVGWKNAEKSWCHDGIAGGCGEGGDILAAGRQLVPPLPGDKAKLS